MAQFTLNDFYNGGSRVFTVPALYSLLDKRVWPSRAAEMLGTTRQRVAYHIREGLLSGVLDKNKGWPSTYKVNWAKVKTPSSRSKGKSLGVGWQPQRFVAVFHVLHQPKGQLYGFIPYDTGKWVGGVLRRDGVTLHLKPKRLEIHINNVAVGTIEQQVSECERRAFEWAGWFAKEYQCELSLEKFRPASEWFLTDMSLAKDIARQLKLRVGEQVAGLWVDRTPFKDGTVEVATEERRRLDDLFSGRLEARVDEQLVYIGQLQKVIDKLVLENAALIQLVQKLSESRVGGV